MEEKLPKSGHPNHDVMVLFVVCDAGFQVVRLADIDKHVESISKASKTVLDDFAVHTTVSLGSRPQYISLSSDNTTVSVCFKDLQTNAIQLYHILGFKAPVTQPFAVHAICWLFLALVLACSPQSL